MDRLRQLHRQLRLSPSPAARVVVGWSVVMFGVAILGCGPAVRVEADCVEQRASVQRTAVLPSAACVSKPGGDDAADTGGADVGGSDVGGGEAEGSGDPDGGDPDVIDTDLEVDAGPSPRVFRRIVPGGTGSEPPAIFMGMHGCGGASTSISTRVRDELARRGVDVLTLAPDSAIADAGGDGDGQGEDGAKCWTLDPQGYDLAFIEALLRDTGDSICVDAGTLLFGGGSSGGFASQAFGCRMGATAIASDRGGIHHPEGLFNFPPTPPPPAEACGPIPTLLGFARQDEVIDYDTYAPVSVEFWRSNNGCGDARQDDPATAAIVCRDELTDCGCERLVDCEAEVVVCSWAGGHEAYGVTDAVMAWWFDRVLSGDSALVSCEMPSDGL